MKIYDTTRDPYYEHGRHSSMQLIIFSLVFTLSVVLTINLALPLLKSFFENNLHGYVYAFDENVPYFLGSKENLKATDWLFTWSVDLYKDTPTEARYWFNPIMIIAMETFLISIIFTAFITTLLPYRFGIMRQKIEREISNMLDGIEYIKYGYHSKNSQNELLEELMNLNSHNFQEFADEISFHPDELRILIKAIKWRESSIFHKVLHINDGFHVYMRFHFTAKYSNVVLGFVYIGASFLIVIIGLRGLKFIPPNEPTYVLFALGMEFTMLVAYAITLIYSKQEDDYDIDRKSRDGNNSALGTELGDSKDVEKLLRVFIKSNKENQ